MEVVIKKYEIKLDLAIGCCEFCPSLTTALQYCLFAGVTLKLPPTNRTQGHENKPTNRWLCKTRRFYWQNAKHFIQKSIFVIITRRGTLTLCQTEYKMKTAANSMKCKVRWIRFEEGDVCPKSGRARDHISCRCLWAVSGPSSIYCSSHAQTHWPARCELCSPLHLPQCERDLPAPNRRRPYWWNSPPTNSMCRCMQHCRSPCTCCGWRGRMGFALDPRWMGRWNVSERSR